jgi:transcriptional regulator with XRE-family HTH domain
MSIEIPTLAYFEGECLPTRERTEFGKWLRAARERRGLTMRALAESLGLSHAHISKLEAGIANPSRVTVQQIAKALSDDPRNHNEALLAAGFAPIEAATLRTIEVTADEERLLAQIRAMSSASAPARPLDPMRDRIDAGRDYEQDRAERERDATHDKSPNPER